MTASGITEQDATSGVVARVASTRWYFTAGGEDNCARVDYYYGSHTFDASFTANAVGRLAATRTGCTNAVAGQVIEMYSYTSAGAPTKKRLRIVRGAVTVDKDVAYGYGSDGKLATVLYPGATIPYTYTYDSMDRPTKMTGPSAMSPAQTVDHAKDVIYGVGGQVTAMKYLQGEVDDWALGDGSHWAQMYFTETKTFNDLFQMIGQQTTGFGGMAADIGYSYSATQNNGRIVSRTNNLRNTPTGETVSYTYDALNRVTAATSNVGWSQAFDFDGFGNLWSQTMTGGSATPMSVNFSMGKNQINSSGWAFDLNGNTTTMPTLGGSSTMTFDLANRMTTWAGPGGSDEYGYLPDNKRV